VNGGQDLGGMDGFGAVQPEPNEPVFHQAWERRAFALTLAMSRPGGWTLDMSRFAREDRPPVEYLSLSYYEIWLAGLQRLLLERDLITEAELAEGLSLAPGWDGIVAVSPPAMAAALAEGTPTERPPPAPPRFAVGQRVRAVNQHPVGHTRLPRYVRGHVGTIERLQGCHVFADSSAMGLGEQPAWLYSVRFEAAELWGARGDPSTSISVDAWEPYLT
jgi:nitrile hydratase